MEREITVTVKVSVPDKYSTEQQVKVVQSILTNGITDEVNAFFEYEMPGVHVTYCCTEVSA